VKNREQFSRISSVIRGKISVKTRIKGVRYYCCAAIRLGGTYHDLGGRFAHGRNDTDDLGRKVTLLAGSFTSTGTPAATQDGLSAAIRVQHHQIAFAQLQVCRTFVC
jgi:hypothetical protein